MNYCNSAGQFVQFSTAGHNFNIEAEIFPTVPSLLSQLFQKTSPLMLKSFYAYGGSSLERTPL